MKIGQCWKFKHGNLSTNPFRTWSGVERAGQQVRRAHSRDSFCAPFMCQRISQAEAAQTPSQRHAALGFLEISPEALASPLQHIFAFSRRRKTATTHVWPKSGGGHKARTSVKESLLSGSARQLIPRQAKQGPGSPPATQECQGKVSALAPGTGSRERSEQ